MAEATPAGDPAGLIHAPRPDAPRRSISRCPGRRGPNTAPSGRAGRRSRRGRGAGDRAGRRPGAPRRTPPTRRLSEPDYQRAGRLRHRRTRPPRGVVGGSPGPCGAADIGSILATSPLGTARGGATTWRTLSAADPRRTRALESPRSPCRRTACDRGRRRMWRYGVATGPGAPRTVEAGPGRAIRPWSCSSRSCAPAAASRASSSRPTPNRRSRPGHRGLRAPRTARRRVAGHARSVSRDDAPVMLLSRPADQVSPAVRHPDGHVVVSGRPGCTPAILVGACSRQLKRSFTLARAHLWPQGPTAGRPVVCDRPSRREERRGGFEPPIRRTPDNGFRDRPRSGRATRTPRAP